MRSASLLLALLVACTPTPDTGAPAEAEASREPAAAILAEVGCARVTFDDLIARAQWEAFAREVPDTDLLHGAWWADEDARDGLIRRDLEAQLLRCDLEREADLPDPQTLDASLEALDAWQRYRDATEPERTLAFGDLPATTIRAFASEPLLYERWLERRLPADDSEEMWEAYQHAADRIVIDVVMVENEPHPSDIARLLRSEPERIQQFYDDQIHEFRLPRRADIELIRRFAPREGRDADAPARQQLTNARARIISGESTFEAEARALSEDLTAENGGRYGIVTRPQFPGLFDLEVGELSEVGEDRVGYYLARIVRWVPPETLPLDDSLARRIALRIAREQEPNPQRLALATEVASALAGGDEASLDALLEEHGLRKVRTPPFPRPDESVPFVGSAPELAAELFESLRETGAQLPEPMLTRNGFAVVQLVERTSATREAFVAEQEAFGQRVRSVRRQTEWREALVEWGLYDVVVDSEAFAAELVSRELQAPTAPSEDAPTAPTPVADTD